MAAGGIGKTSFPQEYLKAFRNDRVLQLRIVWEVQDVASPIATINEGLKKLGEEPAREFSICVYRLREALQIAKLKIERSRSNCGDV